MVGAGLCSVPTVTCRGFDTSILMSLSMKDTAIYAIDVKAPTIANAVQGFILFYWFCSTRSYVREVRDFKFRADVSSQFGCNVRVDLGRVT